MRHTRRLVAFISGLALYSFAILIGGALTKLRLPRSLFSVFGPAGSPSQMLAESALYALPGLLLALAWAYVVLKPQRRTRRLNTAWCLGGLGLAWTGWLTYGMFYLATHPLPAGQSVTAILLSSLMPPVWGVMNGLAPLIGVLLAAWLVRRHAVDLLIAPR
jgi:hypothetical protein